MTDIPFATGLFIKPPHPKAPDYVKCRIGILRQDFIQWLHDQKGEYVNLDVLVSKTGTWYAKVNEWKPETQSAPRPAAPRPATRAPSDPVDFEEDIPF